jgi:hypothetical protein
MQRQKYRQLRQDRHLYYFVSWVHVASNVELRISAIADSHFSVIADTISR